MFVHSPEVNSEKKQAIINAASVTAKKYKVPFIDFTTMDKSIVDYSKDLSDTDYVNINEAAKLTRYLGKYLIDNYDITSHSGNNSFDDWNVASNQFSAKYDGASLTEKKAK